MILYFSYPPRIRFIKAVATFIMALTVFTTGGIWCAVPISHLEVVRQAMNVTVTMGSATVTTIVVVPVCVGALLYLVRQFPQLAEVDPAY